MPPGAWACGSRASVFSPHPGPLPQGEREHAPAVLPASPCHSRETCPRHLLSGSGNPGMMPGMFMACPSPFRPPSSFRPPSLFFLLCHSERSEESGFSFAWACRRGRGIAERVRAFFPSPRPSLARGEGAKGLRTASRPAWAGSGSERMLPFTPCFRRGCPSQALHFRPPPKWMPRR